MFRVQMPLFILDLMLTNLIKVKDAATLLGLSVCTLYRMCEREEIPHVRIARSIRFRPETLTIYLDKREHAVEEKGARDKGGKG